MDSAKTYKLIRSRRRTICLSITQEATLVVKAPLLTPMRYIEQFIVEKKNWINKKITEIKSRPKAKIKEYENGEDFLYLGKSYQLRIAPTKIPVQLKDELIISTTVWPHHKDALKKWYKSEALKIIGDRCKIYSEIMNCSPKSIKISHAMKRWGSCTASGKLNFSWRLVMTPIEIIDYVIVHELSHLHHLNHSRRFWETVKNTIPDYKKREHWLKENNGLLNI
ncbi:MAG: SprT family zinc-dependent metalloprotease [Candidatus Gracilibacteria bacterium]